MAKTIVVRDDILDEEIDMKFDEFEQREHLAVGYCKKEPDKVYFLLAEVEDGEVEWHIETTTSFDDAKWYFKLFETVVQNIKSKKVKKMSEAEIREGLSRLFGK